MQKIVQGDIFTKMKTKIIKGFFWHVHHNKLIEWCYDYNKRVNIIRKNKPNNEIEIRLKLFKKVKNVKVLPKEFIEVVKKYNEAGKKYNEAGKKYNEAIKKYNEAEKKYYKAGKKYNSELEALHKKECECSKWNGKEIIFK